jgi:hypothetical protein
MESIKQSGERNQVKDIIETLEIEPVAWELELHFEDRGAEDPASAERSLEVFLDATMLMEKIAAMGTVTECIIRRADAPPRVEG